MSAFTKTTASIGAAALLIALAACSAEPASSSTDATPVSGGTLTFASGDAEPTCLDPAQSGNVPQALVSTQYIESLFYQSEDGEIEPWLASGWELSEDGLDYTITAQSGISFSDGTAFDAEAIKANIDYIRDPATKSSTGAYALAKVDSVEVTDNTTAVIHLTSPDSALLESLSQVWLPIQSPTALERGLEANCESPVGTGPFIVESWEKQSSITLVRNDDYTSPPPGASHTGPAYLDSIVWKFIPDDASRFAALQTGEVDVVDRVAPESLAALEADSSLTFEGSSRPGYPESLVLNSTKAPFDDVKVREAFIRSLDIDAGLESVYFGSVDRSNSVLSTATKYGIETPDAYSTDVDKAKELLDEAGWTLGSDGIREKDGESLTVSFLINGDQVLAAQKALYEQFQASAKQVGIEVKLNSVDVATRYAQLAEWDYDIASAYYTKNSADVLRLIFDSANTELVGGYHSNTTGIADKDVDKLLRAAAESADEDERTDLYAEAQEIVAAGYYQVPIFDQQTRLGIKNTVVHGTRVIPALSLPTFYDSWLTR